MDFHGFVVSDCGAVGNMATESHYVESLAQVLPFSWLNVSLRYIEEKRTIYRRKEDDTRRERVEKKKKNKLKLFGIGIGIGIGAIWDNV